MRKFPTISLPALRPGPSAFRFPLFALGSLLLALFAAPLRAEDAPRTDPAYRLAVGDAVVLTVFGEPDLSTAQKIDSEGRIRLALIGEVTLAGRTVRESEQLIERTYIERKMLKKPLVTIAVQSYALKEISILGAVRNPGKMQFPVEKTSLDIVEVVTRAGGFTPVARSDAVKITRLDPEGRERVIEINVEAMITGRGRTAATPREFPILPGDRIWVPERLF